MPNDMRRRAAPLSFLYSFFAILLTLFISLIIGIISNVVVVSSNAFRSLLANLSHSFQTEFGFWLVILLLCILILIIIYLTKRRFNILQRSLTIANQIISNDDALLRSLAFLPAAKDYQTEIQKQLTELLQNTRAVFQGRINRAFILLPDESKTNLTIRFHYGLPQESVERIRFYIGSDDSRKKGVAGEAYCRQKLIVAHIIKRDATWIADQNTFTPSTEKQYPRYRSFICVPILVPNMDTTVLEEQSISSLGVVCFDSMSMTIFDDTALQDLLRLIASHIGAILLIYQRFQIAPKTEDTSLYDH